MRYSDSSFERPPTVAHPRLDSFFPRLGWLSVAGLLAALALGGCTTGDVVMMVTTAGGAKVQVPFDRSGIARTEEDGIRILSTLTVPDAEKKGLAFNFEFSDARSRALRSVKVEDVSEDGPFVLVDDAAPQLTAGHWRKSSPSFGVDDAAIKWVLNLENSVRLMRFTIVFADGRKLVLDQGALYPNTLKTGIRKMFGKDY